MSCRAPSRSSALQNEFSIALLVSGENERLIEIIHEMCRRAM